MSITLSDGGHPNMRLDYCSDWPYLSTVQRIFGRWLKWIVKDIEMKSYPSVYPGDNILQPGKVPGSDVESEWTTAALRVPFVHSSMRADGKLESRIDLVAVEEQARAARSAWIGSQLKTLFAALARKFERIAKNRLERQLTATNRVCHN
jgi:hypothetical protein